MTNVIQVVGYKNTGKTTLIEKLVDYFSEQGFRTGTIKHDGHNFEMDHEKTDTWRHRKAGATITAITSGQKSAILKKSPMTLHQMIAFMKSEADIIFVEGFKEADYPKVVMLKEDQDQELLAGLSNIMACMTWFSTGWLDYPVFSIEDKQQLCYFLNQNVRERNMDE
ncbi:molybdopterin-guanine dinucleotide biosynthesis protein B [Salinibacillus kushneri]|uniref:Molybdopterin-guanine dinucleotide biosynthesis protein B n=1 Tax=Salinibacillus kushneri TaxID=237682 RepID=A0A1I0IN93_9BACI|nr:molybdopterin-guanine dinucleotide biosynthesis protein B [Salinibacillus kushneri]SET98628.1 molybdopterin-guanine dinucleotide biosynthesis protein B [Salinibacillus kushneri]